MTAKEMFEEMLHCIEMNCKHNKCFGGVKLDDEDCKLLLDYITNLQQENEKLKYNARGQVNDYFKDKYADEVLKNAELTDYKSRCEKAMEHIEESLDILKGDSDIPITTGNVRNRYLKPVLNILNGSDEK